MYNKISRFALMAAFAILALVSLYLKQYELAAIAGFLFAFILWSHFKHSSVLLASKHFQNGDFDRAEELLDQVPNPDRLAKNRRGYYEFMRGKIALQRNDVDTAEYHYQIASRFPFGGTNEKALILIQLANFALMKNDFARALAYTDRTKTLKTSTRVQEIIKNIENKATILAKKHDEE